MEQLERRGKEGGKGRMMESVTPQGLLDVLVPFSRLQQTVEAHLSTSTRLRYCIKFLLKGSLRTKSTILQHISLVMFLPHIILSDFQDTIKLICGVVTRVIRGCDLVTLLTLFHQLNAACASIRPSRSSDYHSRH